MLLFCFAQLLNINQHFSLIGPGIQVREIRVDGDLFVQLRLKSDFEGHRNQAKDTTILMDCKLHTTQLFDPPEFVGFLVNPHVGSAKLAITLMLRSAKGAKEIGGAVLPLKRLRAWTLTDAELDAQNPPLTRGYAEGRGGNVTRGASSARGSSAARGASAVRVGVRASSSWIDTSAAAEKAEELFDVKLSDMNSGETLVTSVSIGIRLATKTAAAFGIEVIYEYERLSKNKKVVPRWGNGPDHLLTSDPGRWSTQAGEFHPTIDEAARALPPGWTADVWQASSIFGAGGYQYATKVFGAPGLEPRWHNACTPRDQVRRKVWFRCVHGPTTAELNYRKRNSAETRQLNSNPAASASIAFASRQVDPSLSLSLTHDGGPETMAESPQRQAEATTIASTSTSASEVAARAPTEAAPMLTLALKTPEIEDTTSRISAGAAAIPSASKTPAGDGAVRKALAWATGFRFVSSSIQSAKNMPEAHMRQAEVAAEAAATPSKKPTNGDVTRGESSSRIVPNPVQLAELAALQRFDDSDTDDDDDNDESDGDSN